MIDFFKDKTVIVTGASKGIGRAIVYSLLSSGAKVAGVARSKKLLDGIAADSSNLRGEFIGVVCDVSNHDEVASAIKLITDKFGVADIFINNAGMGLVGPALQTSEEEIKKCFDVNFNSAVNCVKYIAPKMIERRSGTIVNVASVVAKYGLPTCSFYSAAKAALAVYSQALRTELAPAGINVITVYPGNTDTEFQENKLVTKNFFSKQTHGKQLSQEFVAGKIIWAIEKGKTEIIIGSQGKILILLKSLSLSLVEYMLKKQFGIAKWYRKNSRSEGSLSHYLDKSIMPGVVLQKMDKKCHYHGSTEFLNWWNVLPEGLSPSLYYVLYPYLLATTYGGNIPKDQAFINPILKNAKSALIKKRNLPYLPERVKNFAKTLLSPIMPLARVKTLPVIDTQEGTYLFDLGYEGTMCPAAFRSVFPYLVYNHLQNKKNTKDSSWEICCPDHIKNLTYGNGGIDDTFFEYICYWGKAARIESKSECKVDKNVCLRSLDEIMNVLGFPCPALLNVMYGYYLTLAKGGELAFYSKSFDAAVAQCPNPKSRVVIEIYRRAETIEFNTIGVEGCSCPRGIEKGNTFFLPRNTEKNKYCLDAFNSLFLSCGLAEFSEEPLNVNCVLHNCTASWQVEAVNKG